MMARRIIGTARRVGGWWVEVEWWFDPRELWAGVRLRGRPGLYREVFVGLVPGLPLRVYWNDLV